MGTRVAAVAAGAADDRVVQGLVGSRQYGTAAAGAADGRGGAAGSEWCSNDIAVHMAIVA